MKIKFVYPTLITTILFTFLYWVNEQKAESSVVFVAGGLSVWILITIMFHFEKARDKKEIRHKRARYNIK